MKKILFILICVFGILTTSDAQSRHNERNRRPNSHINHRPSRPNERRVHPRPYRWAYPPNKPIYQPIYHSPISAVPMEILTYIIHNYRTRTIERYLVRYRGTYYEEHEVVLSGGIRLLFSNNYKRKYR